jgi:hypothetical protein
MGTTSGDPGRFTTPLVGLAIYWWELRRRRMLDSTILLISVGAVVGGAIGARTITAWEHLPYYSNFGEAPLSILVEHSGKSLIGAIAGGWIAIVVLKRWLGYTRSTGDCYALAIPVAIVIGRVGCYFSELPLGTPTELPWGVRVPPEAAAAFAVCPGCDLPMHPSMVYEILFNLAAIAISSASAPRAGAGRHPQALPAGGRDLPLRCRVRARQPGPGVRADRSAARAPPAPRVAPPRLRPTLAEGRLSDTTADAAVPRGLRPHSRHGRAGHGRAGRGCADHGHVGSSSADHVDDPRRRSAMTDPPSDPIRDYVLATRRTYTEDAAAPAEAGRSGGGGRGARADAGGADEPRDPPPRRGFAAHQAGPAAPRSATASGGGLMLVLFLAVPLMLTNIPITYGVGA